jgi:hypothetical protein
MASVLAHEGKGAPFLIHPKPATIYTRGGLGYTKRVVRRVSVKLEPYAQHPAGATVIYVAKGARKPRGFVETTYPSTVVVDGECAFSIRDPFTPVRESGEVLVSQGRHFGHSPEWDREFARDFGEFLQLNPKTRVLADLRALRCGAPIEIAEEALRAALAAGWRIDVRSGAPSEDAPRG